MKWWESEPIPPLTAEKIREIVKKLRAKPINLYADCYWIVPVHWFSLFSRN